MSEIAVKALVPTARLDQLIGSGDPTSSEIHDMAVELILWRRSVERKAEPLEHVEKVSTEAAMSQWERSLKRPDLCEKDRVRGAIEAYKRQAFAFAISPSPPAAPVADTSITKLYMEAAKAYRGYDHDFNGDGLMAAVKTVAAALSASPSPVDGRDGLEAARMAHRETLDLLHIRNEKLNAAEQRIEQLVKALEKIAEDTRRCDHDMGYDREMGPLGCSLGDRCVCMGIHMTARAALAAAKEST